MHLLGLLAPKATIGELSLQIWCSSTPIIYRVVYAAGSSTPAFYVGTALWHIATPGTGAIHPNFLWATALKLTEHNITLILIVKKLGNQGFYPLLQTWLTRSVLWPQLQF